jgi:hypothetical protein
MQAAGCFNYLKIQDNEILFGIFIKACLRWRYKECLDSGDRPAADREFRAAST